MFFWPASVLAYGAGFLFVVMPPGPAAFSNRWKFKLRHYSGLCAVASHRLTEHLAGQTHQKSEYGLLSPCPPNAGKSHRKPAPSVPRLTKKRPPCRRGPSCLGSLALRELFWRPDGGVAVGAERSLGGGVGRFYGLSAPAEAGAPWGDAAAWAAKLFSINTHMHTADPTRSGFWSCRRLR